MLPITFVSFCSRHMRCANAAFQINNLTRIRGASSASVAIKQPLNSAIPSLKQQLPITLPLQTNMISPLGKESRISHTRNHSLFTTRLSSSSSSSINISNPNAILKSLDPGDLKRLVEEANKLYEQNYSTVPPLDRIQAQISDYERESSDPEFWSKSNSKRADYVNGQLSQKRKLIERVESWDGYIGDCEAALEFIEELANDDSERETVDQMIVECYQAARSLLEDVQRYELERFLSGPLDDRPARIVLTAGAGGMEACDWVDMLHRMYLRHAERMSDFKIRVEEKTPGDIGYKSVELVVEGTNAYGWFKGEKGAHRLVRVNPLSTNKKRQTTFAGVDIVPILDDEEVKDISIPASELEITTMRSGGKGGQNVNKVESGVRIKHVPTGVSVKCTQERSQLMNKDIAMRRIKAQLLALAQEQRCAEIQAIRGDAVEAAWGAQIRNYVLQPYQMIKDQRTNWESSDTQGFLDGDLEKCIGALLRFRAKEEAELAQEEAERNSNN